MTTPRYATLEVRLGYRFSAAALPEQALTHRSHGPQNNERLEFLGDGVLGCAVADELYARFPQLPEGKLTRLRAGLVREETLAEVGERLGLRELLRVDPGTPVTVSILADALEALFGAVFLDGGYAASRATLLTAFGPLLDALDPAGPAKDAKTELQEALQARRRQLPEYRILAVRGAAHQQSFEVECALPELGLSTSGSGTSRQRAEQQAAQAMLQRLEP